LNFSFHSAKGHIVATTVKKTHSSRDVTSRDSKPNVLSPNGYEPSLVNAMQCVPAYVQPIQFFQLSQPSHAVGDMIFLSLAQYAVPRPLAKLSTDHRDLVKRWWFDL